MSVTPVSGLEKIEQIIKSIEGVIGVAAWNLNAAQGEKPPILINAEQLFPTASTIKVPILYELYCQVEVGKLQLDQRIELKPEQLVPGSGVLQDLSFGLQPTVRDLAVLMTVVSDNTATDLILDLVGLSQVEETMQSLGLNNIKSPMNIRGMLYSLAGLDPANPEHTYQMCRTIFDDPAHKTDPNCRALSETDNVLASPYDMAQLLNLIARHEVLNVAACEDMLDILSRQKYNTILPFYLPSPTRVAHKTGSINRVRNDVGIVYAPNGPYAVALMSKGMTNEADGVQKLARLSEAIYQYFL